MALKRAVLVYADGRTSSMEGHGFGNWLIQNIPPEDYRERGYRERYFKNIGHAYTERTEEGGPKDPVIVLVERSAEEYRRG